MAPAWKHVRAALIAVHLAVITVAAFPTPAGYLTEKNKTVPEVKASLEAWGAIAIDLGIAEDQPAFVDLVWRAGQGLVDARAAVIDPFESYFWLTGTRQSWRMFGSVDRRVGRFEVHLLENGEWRPLYIDLTEHDWSAALLEQERVRALRKLFAIGGGKRSYKHFVRFLADRAEADFPEAEALRVRFQGLDIPAPDVVLAQGGLTETKIRLEETVTFREAP